MANLKEVRTRIESVKSTKQITSAMKMVAASKLRKAQNAVLTLRPYSNRLSRIMQNIMASLPEEQQSPYSTKRTENKVLFVLLSSNKGLCGAFNANVYKRARKLIDETYKQQLDAGNIGIICSGRKVGELMQKLAYPVISRHDDLFDRLNFDDVAAFAQQIMDMFTSSKYDKVILIYNQFVNPGTQNVVDEQFLPVSDAEVNQNETQNTDYIFEPNREIIVKELIPKILKVQLYKAFLNSYASEHGARMTAMHQATDNATQMLSDLNLAYNKARQAAITTEIVEIVSGAEALNG